MSGQQYQLGTTKIHYMYIRRKVNYTITLDSGSAIITGTTLKPFMPDGAKILNFKAINRTSRNLRIRIPKETRLFQRGAVNNVQGENEIADLHREVWAPLSRFPSIKVNVPDTLASGIDVDNTVTLFEVLSLDGLGATVTLSVTYQTMV